MVWRVLRAAAAAADMKTMNTVMLNELHVSSAPARSALFSLLCLYCFRAAYCKQSTAVSSPRIRSVSHVTCVTSSRPSVWTRESEPTRFYARRRSFGPGAHSRSHPGVWCQSRIKFDIVSTGHAGSARIRPSK